MNFGNPFNLLVSVLVLILIVVVLVWAIEHFI